MYSGVFFAIIGVAVMARCILPVWIWGGCPRSGRAIHRAEDLVGDSCAAFKVIGPIHGRRPGSGERTRQVVDRLADDW